MTKPETVKVTLKKPHTHKGENCKAGDEITVTKKQAEWLKKMGTA